MDEPRTGHTTTVEVLVPVKDFREAKLRLAPRLDATARAELSRAMAERVLAAAAPLPVRVVCDDAAVSAWARACGAGVSWQPGRGLNEAVSAAVDELAAAGVDRAIVAHADLPLARDLRWLADEPGEVLLVPDRHGDGTNVIVVPTQARFPFSYGPASFDRHLAVAHELGLDVRVLHDEWLAWDVDVPGDLSATVGLTTT